MRSRAQKPALQMRDSCFRLCTFMPMIIGEIRRYLRDNSALRVSRSLRDMAYKAMQAKEAFI